MEGRTIALLGGGELIIGGGPLIEGLIHAWVKNPGKRTEGFMISCEQAERLAQLLRGRQDGEVKLFAGRATISHGASGIAFLWLYSWGREEPDCAARLLEGAIDVAAEALAELCVDEQLRSAA